MTSLCCRCFALPFSPEEIWENYLHYIVYGWWEERTLDAFSPNDGNGVNMFMGVAWLVEHIRYIGLRPGSMLYPGSKRLIHFYTCDMLNPRTGMCRDHRNRHEMCVIYNRCEHPDCDSLWCSVHPSAKLRTELANTGCL